MSSPLPDTVVVGAGIIGASIAWRLAQAGSRVTLLDTGKLGAEASWAGAGMLAPGGEILERSAWSGFALESLGLYPAFVGELESETGCEIDFKKQGAVELAWTETEWNALLARAREQEQMGIRSAVLNDAGLRECVPLLEKPSALALLYPEDCLVDPRDVTHALRAACEQHRVEIHESQAALAIRADSRSVEVETAIGALAAKNVVLAAGAWSSEIPVFIDGSLVDLPKAVPVKGHLLGYTLPARSLPVMVRYGKTYVLQRSSGLAIAGTSSEEVGFDRRIDTNIVADIAFRAGELIPVLRSATAPAAWVGFRPGTETLQPAMGRFADSNLWLAYGHYRNGILLAPATAQQISREITTSSEKGSCLPAGNR